MKYLLVMSGFRVCTVLADDGQQCNAWNGYCGGCTGCLLTQAQYNGCTVHELKGFWKFYEWVYIVISNTYWSVKRKVRLALGYREWF